MAARANADVCSSTPVSLPGLSGVPIWAGTTGFVRTDLNDPRWAGAPQMAFESDVTGNEGLYRVMADPGFTELSVSFQAPTDPSAPSAADVVYFGFTTDGTAGTLAKTVAIQVPGGTGADPVVASGVQQHNYDAAAATKWTAPLGVPSWLKLAYGWRMAGTGAAWGINFKVDLVAAGLSSTSAFKIILAMHKADEATPANSVNVSTPDPGTHTFVAGTRIIDDPTAWQTATAINLGCASGITLASNQIGTRNTYLGSPAPTLINTTSGGVNEFYATPTIPGSVSLFAGLFQAKFHIANWGSIADPNAAWTTLPNGAAVLNGASPAPDNGTVDFNCPANTSTSMCGITPVPTETHQCVYVELKAAPGQSVPITTASAYRNMDFKPLSDFSAPAEISVKGLEAKLGNKNPRDVYVYIYPKNMPAQGKQALWLPTDKMAATKMFADSPPPPVRHVDPKEFAKMMKERAAAIQRDADAQKRAAADKKKAAGQKNPPQVAPKVGDQKQHALAEKTPPKPLPEMPLPRTGIGDLDLNPMQALATVWPTYDVHVYYDSGRTTTIDGVTSKELVPMYPFTYFHSHEGPLYGFSHSFKVTGGATVTEIRPNVYLLKIASEGSAKVLTEVKAHETPSGVEVGPPAPQPCPGCPACPPPPVEKGGHCGCRVPGSTDHGDTRTLLLGAGALALALARRRRRL